MQNINAAITARRTQLANAKQRANEAESKLKEKEPLLEERSKTVEDLKTRVDLQKRCNQLSKDLLTVLQKLDDTRKKLVLVEERLKAGDTKTQSIYVDADSFESKYRQTKKNYEELLQEMESLRIN